MRKTLGGDRLGSGNRQQVDLYNYGRSTHNLSKKWRSTLSPGTIAPAYFNIGLPGDTWKVRLTADVKTLPTIGPLFGSYKLQWDWTTADIRLYQGQLHNNKLKVGMNMSNVKLPIIQMKAQTWTQEEAKQIADLDNSQINPSCIVSYLGIRGIGVNIDESDTDGIRTFSALGLLAYWDNYKTFYANKQEERGFMVHTKSIPIVTNIDEVTQDGDPIPVYPTTSASWLAGIINLTKTDPEPSGQYVMILMRQGQFGEEYWVRLSDIAHLTAVGVNEIWTPKNQYVAGNGIGSGWQVLAWRYMNGSDRPPVTEIDLQEFPLEQIDEMRERILAHAVNTTPFNVSAQTDLIPYSYWNLQYGTPENPFYTRMCSQEGLGIKTYQSDLFNNWLNTEWLDGPNGVNEITRIDTSEGLTIDAFQLARKVYDYLNRVAVSGGSYDDWLDVTWSHERYTRPEEPRYQGGMMREIMFQEVVSNAEATNEQGTQPLGTLAGRGMLAGDQKGGYLEFTVSEPCVVMSFISITPRIDYSQGNAWHIHLETLDDLHKPGMDEIGFQELITEQMAWWDTEQISGGTWRTRSAGKQPAWLNYMTDYNTVHGNFAIQDMEQFMILTRRYTPEYEDNQGFKINDLTTYIDPRKYNYIFANTALDSQNFWVQLGMDIEVRRVMSAKLMPNL